MHILAVIAILAGAFHWTSSCDIKAKGVTEADKKAILKIHNELRAKIANGNEKGFPQAANMMEMTWDNHLAKEAQDWADQCNFNHNKPKDINGGHAGQNLAREKKSSDIPMWEKRIQSFYNEVKSFEPKDIHKYAFDKATGHFTQVIWAESNKVGCGYVRYAGKSYKNELLYVCNYAPGGNVRGRPIYKVGRPCSQCGGCGSIKGLCKSK